MNVCILSGVICKGLEFITSQNNNLFAKGTIAVKKPYTVDENKSQYDFIKFYTFGKTAQHMQKSLNEKDIVIFNGEWNVNKYTLNDGKICTSNELYVNKFDIVKKANDEFGG